MDTLEISTRRLDSVIADTLTLRKKAEEMEKAGGVDSAKWAHIQMHLTKALVRFRRVKETLTLVDAGE